MIQERIRLVVMNGKRRSMTRTIKIAADRQLLRVTGSLSPSEIGIDRGVERGLIDGGQSAGHAGAQFYINSQ